MKQIQQKLLVGIIDMLLANGISVNPAIQLLTLSDPSTWYAYTFPVFTTSYIINSDSTIRVSTTSDGTEYFTFAPQRGGLPNNIKGRAVGLTLYFQSPDAGAIARILSWQN